ncbi:MAG: LLM class F420-dependent oxidoreductase [Deltaproteobacteria bacterium]|nr:LLM class F420-dependent oxidoreductase [Deltaproteobacteria bacterium]
MSDSAARPSEIRSSAGSPARPVGVLCPAGPEDVLPSDYARKAEALGFESIWVGEHPAVPVQIERDYVQLVDGHLPYFYTNLADPWMTLAHAAGATTTIRFGTAVGLVTLRHPLLLAKILATLDRQSRGRLVVGAGAAWLIEEMELFGVEFATRFERLEEMVAAMRRIWTEDVVEFHGKHVDFPPLYCRYPSWQKPIPVLCGVHGPRGMKMAARWADGWIPIGADPEILARDVKRYHTLCEEAGRDPAAMSVTTMAAVDETTDPAFVRSLFEAGANRVILAIGTVTTTRTVREGPGDVHPLSPERYARTLESVAARFVTA